MADYIFTERFSFNAKGYQNQLDFVTKHHKIQHMRSLAPAVILPAALSYLSVAWMHYDYISPPYEHCGCFSCGDLDGPPSLLHPKSLNLSLKLFLGVLTLLD